MATPLTLAQITAAYTKWHVPFEVYPGAATRGRPGGITSANGIVEHHTGGGSASASYLKFLFVDGRPEEGIPGPLCNEATASDGTVYIGAVGRANHAGSGSSRTHDHVVAEDYAGYTSELEPGPDGLNGNAVYYGNEWIYSGTVPPTALQYRAAALAASARCDAHGWSALSVIAHREHTDRKDDPYAVKMYAFRSAVNTLLKAGPAACVNYVATGKLGAAPTPPPTAPEDDVTTPNHVVGTNTDGTPMTMAQLAARTNFIYQSILEGGKIDAALDNITATVDRIEDDTDKPTV
jgi:hypothetical protein